MRAHLRGLDHRPGPASTRPRPTVRTNRTVLAVQLLLVYAVAAVAKMNTGFFDPSLSCAATMVSRLPWSHLSFFDGSWKVVASIWGTTAVEVTLPVLLAVRRSRMLGLVVGGAFHAVLALTGNVPFSALALALYVAFLPSDTPTRLRALAATRPGLGRWADRARRVSRSPAALPVTVAWWLAGAALFTRGPGLRSALIEHGTALLMVAALADGILVVLYLARGGSHRHSPTSLRVRHPISVAGILVLVANSLSPYVGLKTDSSLTMFSNLHTEDGQWNHLFIPSAIRISPIRTNSSGSSPPTTERSRPAQATVCASCPSSWSATCGRTPAPPPPTPRRALWASRFAPGGPAPGPRR